MKSPQITPMLAPDKPPKNLGKTGRNYWKTVATEFQVPEDRADLLAAACVQLDRAAQAREAIARDGLTVRDKYDQVKIHPAVECERQAHLAFLRLQRELGLDVDVPETRGPRRPGTER